MVFFFVLILRPKSIKKEFYVYEKDILVIIACAWDCDLVRVSRKGKSERD